MKSIIIFILCLQALLFFGCAITTEDFPTDWGDFRHKNYTVCPSIEGVFSNIGYLGPHKEVLPPYLDEDITLERIVIPSIVVNAKVIEITNVDGNYRFVHKTGTNVLYIRNLIGNNDFNCENGFLTFSAYRCPRPFRLRRPSAPCSRPFQATLCRYAERPHRHLPEGWFHRLPDISFFLRFSTTEAGLK